MTLQEVDELSDTEWLRYIKAARRIDDQQTQMIAQGILLAVEAVFKNLR